MCIIEFEDQVRVLADGPGDLCSISSRVVSKTQEIILDATLHYTQLLRYESRVNEEIP